MKRLLATTALALALSSPASAFTLLSYDLPNANAFNDVTTDGYSYYTGPIIFHTDTAGTFTVYCADLNHILQSGQQYAFSLLTTRGDGTPISEAMSNRIGNLAAFGINAQTFPDLADQDYAVAAQANIWDTEYGIGSTSTDGTIGALITILGLTTFANNGHYALSVTPYGVGWPENGYASQQMVVGLASGVPEPSTWAMGLIGFGLVGFMGYRKRWTALPA